MPRYVTKTGRAVRTGRTTRKSLSVRRPAVKPLPLHLQCHPPALHRTPMHPKCRTTNTDVWGAMLALLPAPAMRLLTADGISLTPPPEGRWPDRGRPQVPLVRVVIDGLGTWYASDSARGMAWAKSVRSTFPTLTVKVYIDR